MQEYGDGTLSRSHSKAMPLDIHLCSDFLYLLCQHITFLSEEWLFDGQPLRVGYGSYKAHCDSARLFCAGGTKYGLGLSLRQRKLWDVLDRNGLKSGFGILQARAVRVAIQCLSFEAAKAGPMSLMAFFYSS